MDKEILAYHRGLDKSDQEICEKLYEVICQQLPDAEHKIWHRHPVWFLEGNPIVGYHKLKDCVRLLFWPPVPDISTGRSPRLTRC